MSANIEQLFEMTDEPTTGYQGNGWSKYQIFVLRQLEDHNKLLTQLNERLGAITTRLELDQRNQQEITKSLKDINGTLDFIMDDDRGINRRLSVFEAGQKTDKEVANAIGVRSRALWATVGGGAVFVMSTLLQVAGHLISLFK